MKFMGFLFVFLFSLSGQAMQCLDIFSQKPKTNDMSFLEHFPENFVEMNIYERQEVLDYMAVHLNSKVTKAPKPFLLHRVVSLKAARQHREYQRLKALQQAVLSMKDAYHVVSSLLHGEVKKHNLEREDEIQLLNRLMVDPEILGALSFLDRRQTDLHGKDQLEQYFIDSVVMYLAWGPNPKKFPVPINSWLIFDIFMGHQDMKYMIAMSHRFRDAAQMYKRAKKGLNTADALVEDYSLQAYDPVFEIIEKTEKGSPHLIERLLDQEIDNGHVVYDPTNNTLRVVDESL